MRIAGIVCECNPFHTGHQYLIDQVRQAGADAVVAVMSGCFVQRGEAAIADPFVRAEALLGGGVDLVVELPFPYSSASAEFFASAGVEILSRLGVGELWFGSECGDVGLLSRLASIADSEEMRTLYTETVRGSDGTATAYFECLSKLAGEGIVCSPNDILGVSYLRALQAMKSPMKAYTVKRVGSGYSEKTLSDKAVYPSATALRRVILSDGVQLINNGISPQTKELLLAASMRGEAPATLCHAERLILGTLRSMTPSEADTIVSLEGGLGARLCEASHKAATLEELLTFAATKKYPTARLQRGILFAMNGIRAEDLRAPISYVRLLGANQKGREVLAASRKFGDLPVVTKRADLPKTAGAIRQMEHEERAWALYSLCMPKAAPSDSLWRHMPVILE